MNCFPKNFGLFTISRVMPRVNARTLETINLNRQQTLKAIGKNVTPIIILIGLAVRVFANGPGDLSSIPGRLIPKTQKMVLDASLLNTQHYKVRIKGKVEQSREGVAPSPTPWCSNYRKGSLRVTLDYGRQLYFYIYIYRYIEREYIFWQQLVSPLLSCSKIFSVLKRGSQ